MTATRRIRDFSEPPPDLCRVRDPAECRVPRSKRILADRYVDTAVEAMLALSAARSGRVSDTVENARTLVHLARDAAKAITEARRLYSEIAFGSAGSGDAGEDEDRALGERSAA